MPSSKISRLYVGNINHKVRPREVEKLFTEYGSLVDFDFKDRGQQVNFCFVEYRRSSDAELAIENLSGRRLMGAPLIVEPARDRNEKKSGSHNNSFARNPRGKRHYDSESSRSRSRGRRSSHSGSRSRRHSGRHSHNGNVTTTHTKDNVGSGSGKATSKSKSRSKSHNTDKSRSRSRKRRHSPRYNNKSQRSKRSHSSDSKKRENRNEEKKNSDDFKTIKDELVINNPEKKIIADNERRSLSQQERERQKDDRRRSPSPSGKEKNRTSHSKSPLQTTLTSDLNVPKETETQIF